MSAHPAFRLRDAAIQAALWLGTALLSEELLGVTREVSALWLPDGAALAGLLRSRGRGPLRCVSIGIAAFGFEILRGLPPLQASLRALVHVAVPAAGAYALGYWLRDASREHRALPLMLVSIPGLVLLAGVIAMTPSGAATAGLLTALWVAGLLGTMLARGKSQALPPALRMPPWPRLLETGVLLSLGVILTDSALRPRFDRGPVGLLPSSAVALLVWATLRFAARGATAAAFVLSAVTLHAMHGRAEGTPFGPGAEAPLLQAQVFLIVLSLCVLIGAEALEGHKSALARLPRARPAVRRESQPFRRAKTASRHHAMRAA